MKKIFFCVLLNYPLWVLAQIGIKGGLNFSGITNASSINSSSQTGFNAGIFLGAFDKGIIGFRTEMTYSKQGYNYLAESNTGKVNLQYFMSSNLATINVSKYLQIQVGFQTSLLLNATEDSRKMDIRGHPFDINPWNMLTFFAGLGLQLIFLGSWKRLQNIQYLKLKEQPIFCRIVKNISCL